MFGAQRASDTSTGEPRAPQMTSQQLQAAEGVAPILSIGEQIERIVRHNHTSTQQVASASAVQVRESSVSSTLAAAGKTLALATGIGPLATGMLKLFGRSSDSSDALPEQTLWSRPARLVVDAALDGNRNLQPVSYSSDGEVRVASAQNQRSSPSLPPVQINVSAMDSRSFLDHSDDIARAVREALLRSSELTDVIAEF